MLTKTQAKAAEQEIISVCNKYGLWYTLEYEKKPDLRAIKIKEISIKVLKN